jgi:hypothetical protein
MRRQKASRRIVVDAVEYRWHATGNDGYISIAIWPANKVGSHITCNLLYHERWDNNGDGSLTSRNDQIVVTNRIVRRIIDHAVAEFGYEPNKKANQLSLKSIDNVIDWATATRASDGSD